MGKQSAAIALGVCLLFYPFASYVVPVVLGLILVTLIYQDPLSTWKPLISGGWLPISVGLVLTCLTAVSPRTAAPQLINFLPFFLAYATILGLVLRLNQPFQALRLWATGIVLAAIPISLRAALEYYLKAPTVMESLISSPYLDWLYGRVNYGQRADSVFGHPNVLASYLVVAFGLGLGLCLQQVWAAASQKDGQGQRLERWLTFGVYAGTILSLVGIYLSGSRSGVAIAAGQLLLFGWLVRRYWLTAVAGLAGVGAIATGVTLWGIGGRSVGEALGSVSLRLEVWRIALGLVRQYPWLGSGFGGYRELYQPYSIRLYESVEHAHNLWLMLASEVGIPLTVAITLAVGWPLYRGIRALITQNFTPTQRALLTAYGLGFLGSILYSCFDVPIYDARVNFLGWLLLAVIHAIPELSASPRARMLDQLNQPQPKVQADGKG